jgi:hypothetical protein
MREVLVNQSSNNKQLRLMAVVVLVVVMSLIALAAGMRLG